MRLVYYSSALARELRRSCIKPSIWKRAIAEQNDWKRKISEMFSPLYQTHDTQCRACWWLGNVFTNRTSSGIILTQQFAPPTECSGSGWDTTVPCQSLVAWAVLCDFFSVKFYCCRNVSWSFPHCQVVSVSELWCKPQTLAIFGSHTWIILCIHPANERRCCNVTSSLIGWNILAGLWLNYISSVEITLFLLADILLQHRALFQC